MNERSEMNLSSIHGNEQSEFPNSSISAII